MNSIESFSKSLAGLISFALVGAIIGKTLRYIMNYIIGVEFGAEILGYFTFGLVLIRAGSVFVSIGLRTSSQRFISQYNEREDIEGLVGATIVFIVVPLSLGVIFSTIMYIIWPYISNIFGVKIEQTVRIFFLGVPLFALMNVLSTATRGFKETKYFVYSRELGQSGVAVLLIAISAYIISDPGLLVFAYFSSLCIGISLSVWYLYKLGALRSKVSPKIEFHELMSVSLPLLIVAASQYLVSWTDILMLGILTGAREVGYYQVAFLYSVILLLFTQSINSIFPSIASGLYETNQTNELHRVYSVTTKWGIYMTGIGSIVVLSFPEVLLRLFGSEFTAATTALVILIIGRVIATIPGPSAFMLSMSEYENIEAINTFCFGALNLLLNFALIPKFGIEGAAIATSLSLVGMHTTRLIQVRYLMSMHPYHSGFLKGLFSLFIVSGFVWILAGVSQHILAIPAVTILATLLFLLIMWVIGFDEEDEYLWKMV